MSIPACGGSGVSPEEAIAIAPRLQSENHGLTLLMSHLACADTPDHPLNDKQIRLFRDIRINFRGLAVLARQFVRDLHRQHGALRPGAPRHRALRLEPDPRTQQSHAAGGRTQGPHHPGPHDRPRRYRRLWRELHRRAGRAASRSSPSATPTAICARRAPPRAKPPRNVIVAGKLCPIVGRVTMDLIDGRCDRSAGRHRAARRLRDADRRRHRRRRSGRRDGNGRLRGADHLGRRYHRIYKDA